MPSNATLLSETEKQPATMMETPALLNCPASTRSPLTDMPGHDGCNTALLCVSQRGIFPVMMHRRSSPSAQTAASGIPLPRSLSPASPGELQTRARESQPTFPTFHLSGVPFVPTEQAHMKAETLGGRGGTQPSTLTPPHTTPPPSP